MQHNVVALISGGKDSCFNMMECVRFGHRIVALANLHPSSKATDELDSFMYQTVGHQAVEAYARCMELPLFRAEIAGSAIRQEMEYVRTPDDEVENLFALLQNVKTALPHITAVSSGAILSNYQRLRVENVCSRLGLISLAYLWRRDQEELLQNMIDRQLHAVVIKVAAMGLLPKRHLGRSLQQLQPHLLSLAAKYGCNVCGEGGEYESFTLDCPLFKHRIVLDRTKEVIHSDDAFAPVGLLQLLEYHTEEKTDKEDHTGAEDCGEETEGIPEAGDLQCAARITAAGGDFSPTAAVEVDGESVKVGDTEGAFHGKADAVKLWVKSTRSSFGCVGYVQNEKPAREQLERLLCSLFDDLKERELSMANIYFVSLYVSDMSEFGTLNEVYNRYFEHSPPSRACVEVALPGDTQLLLHAMGSVNTTERSQRLHVQSISHWAPACIGPYSQAVKLDKLVLLAGQIGLDPPTMQLLPGAPMQAKQTRHNVSQVLGVICPSSFVIAARVFISRGADGGRVDEIVAEAENAWGDGKLSLQEAMLLRCYIGVDHLPRNAQLEYETEVVAMEGDEEDFHTSEFEDGTARAVAVWHGSAVTVQAYTLSTERSARCRAEELLRSALRAAGVSLERDVCSITLFHLPSFDRGGVHFGGMPIAHVPTHSISVWNASCRHLESVVGLYSLTCFREQV